jgi:glycosyltransferase involved in cell wall biosynthesis
VSEPAPHVSIVIPVYNEEGILRGSVLELEEKLRRFGWSYELLLCENGSRDRTVEIGHELEAEHPQVRMLSVGEPNYGLAMKQGILEARGTYVICDEIDLLDTEFYARAMALLERSDTDLVVGSKAMVGSNDQRPLFRRAATRVYNGRRWWRRPGAACSIATCSPASSSSAPTARGRRWSRSPSPSARSAPRRSGSWRGSRT